MSLPVLINMLLGLTGTALGGMAYEKASRDDAEAATPVPAAESSEVYTGLADLTQKNMELEAALAEMQRKNTEMLQRLMSLEGEITLSDVKKLVAQVTPSTVGIKGPMLNVQGSGTLLKLQDAQGNVKHYVLTNRHVVVLRPLHGGEDHILDGGFTVFPYADTNISGDMILARVAKGPDGQPLVSDKETDLALLELLSDPTDSMKPAPIAEAIPDVGEFVMVVGSPIGRNFFFPHNVTYGFISHPERKTSADPSNVFLGIDAAIDYGNSGGPAFNQKGEMVGVINQKHGNDNAFALAIRNDKVLETLAQWNLKPVKP